MLSAGGVVAEAGLIDPTRFAGADVDPEAVRTAADGLGRSADEVRQGGADVLGEWRLLAQHYEAPEAHRLLHVMDPVETDSRRFADDLRAVAEALHRYADDVGPALDLRRMVTIEAEWFLGNIARDPEWRRDQRLVDQHTELLRTANDVQVLLWDAERRCANAIRRLSGARSLRPSTSADDPRGYGWSAIPDEAEMPWGAPVQREDVCAKAAFVQVKRFIWDGAVWDGVMGTLKSLGSLVGVGDESDGSWGWSHSWAAAGDAWQGMTALVGHDDGAWSAGTAGDAWWEMAKGLLSWDTWAEDPGRASGGAIFNVASLALPVVGGVRAASVVGNTGRTAAAVRTGAAVVDPTELADDVAADVAVARSGRAAMPDVDVVIDVPADDLGSVLDAVSITDDFIGPRPPEGYIVADWTVRDRPSPIAPREFITPTNPAQPPWRFIPETWQLRVMGRTPDYPDGYWVIETWRRQAIDISIGKPPGYGSRALNRARTHVPLPPDWIS